MDSTEQKAGIAAQIGRIVEQRKKILPAVHNLERECASLGESLAAADAALGRLAAEAGGDDPSVEEDCAGGRERIAGMRGRLEAIIADVGEARSRFEREHVSIVLGGRWGAGKTFFLRALTGLPENVLPSGDIMATTASQCVIVNSDEGKAHVFFISEREFLERRVWSKCEKIGLKKPQTLSEFEKMTIPELDGSSEDDKVQPCRDLSDWKKCLSKYRRLFGSPEKILEIDNPNLPHLVAYDNETESDQKLFLAVDRIEFRVKFCNSDVNNLHLVDLPGIGEKDDSIARMHSGVKESVDLGILLLRPSNRNNWGSLDTTSLAALEKARPTGVDVADFVFFAMNFGENPENRQANWPEACKALENELRKSQSGRYPETSFLKTYNSDSKGFSEDILNPVLNHMTRSLRKADKIVHDGIVEKIGKIRDEICSVSEDVSELLKMHVHKWIVDIGGRAYEAQRTFAQISKEKVIAYLEEKMNYDDNEISEKLDKIESDIISYYENIGESSREKWLANAKKDIAAHNTINRVVEIHLNQMRVHIAEKFSMSLEDFYKKCVSDLQERTVIALNGNDVMNGLLDEGGASSPAEKLGYLLKLVRDPELVCANMEKALDGLCSMKIEHGAQFHPRAYAPLHALKKKMREDPNNQQAYGEYDDLSGWDAVSGVLQNIDPDNGIMAERLHDALAELARATASKIRENLAEEVRGSLYAILLASYEMFDDRIIRARGVQTEWERFFERHFDRICPDEGDRRKADALKAAQESLNGLKAVAGR